MDCVACGKPISITAKFCGKCGAPVKRQEAVLSEAAVHEETSPESVEHAVPVAQPMAPIPTVNSVDE